MRRATKWRGSMFLVDSVHRCFDIDIEAVFLGGDNSAGFNSGQVFGVVRPFDHYPLARQCQRRSQQAVGIGIGTDQGLKYPHLFFTNADLSLWGYMGSR